MAAADERAAAPIPDIEGAEIQYLERRDDGRVVVVFGYRGTDDGKPWKVGT